MEKINDNFLRKETCEKLVKLGFDWDTYAWYEYGKDTIKHASGFTIKDWNEDTADFSTPAPNYWQVQKWLMQKYNITICVTPAWKNLFKAVLYVSDRMHIQVPSKTMSDPNDFTSDLWLYEFDNYYDAFEASVDLAIEYITDKEDII